MTTTTTITDKPARIQLPLFRDPTILPTGKYHVSYSEMADWLGCSFKHKLKHVNKIMLDKPSIHTEFGQAIHDALEHFILTREPITDEVCRATAQVFRESCNKLGEVHGVVVSAQDILDFEKSIPGILKQVPPWLDQEFPGWYGFAAEHYLFESIEGQTNKHFKGFIDTVIRFPKTTSRKKRTVVQAASTLPMMRLSDLVAEVNPDQEPQGKIPSDGFEYWVLDWKTTSWGWPADRKRDFNKQLQLVLYKHFFCRSMGLSLDQVRCGFVLLKRTPRKTDNNAVELIPVSVGPKTELKALTMLNDMVNQIQTGRTIKNRMSCRFCEFRGTTHCP